jgi:hypothetical protein
MPALPVNKCGALFGESARLLVIGIPDASPIPKQPNPSITPPMNTIVIPTEADFGKWIKEAIQECLQEGLAPGAHLRPGSEPEEPLLTRKEIAGLFGISPVTLHDWINRGLPCIRQGGRVYFLRSEVMDYVKRSRPKRAGQL